ncbi:hypothetical protein [Acidithiobacillus sp.]
MVLLGALAAVAEAVLMPQVVEPVVVVVDPMVAVPVVADTPLVSQEGWVVAAAAQATLAMEAVVQVEMWPQKAAAVAVAALWPATVCPAAVEVEAALAST